ncbi:MAG: tyrosine-type recombinase/integrase [Patiriisocius sp.]|uniref:tyrosine-type recombinase/integrase n=1 Tax=Patiriisocius sp. TaxID=2822396 RepID=UPI003EF606D0
MEYVLEYDLKKKKQFSQPKIYDAKGDLSKRWYVYFSFRNPVTGKMERQNPVYGNANSYSTKGERLEVLTMLRRSLADFLKKGYDPYAPEQIPEHDPGQDTKENVPTVQVANTPVTEIRKKGMPIGRAFEKALAIKENVVARSTIVNYRNKTKQFERWLEKNVGKGVTIEQVTKKDVVSFLNEVLERSSARTRNNTRVELGSIFQTLVDNDVIPVNFVQSINVLKTRPERHKTYSDAKQSEIYGYLEKNDRLLLLFVQFISFNFLRPVEVCRLRVGDVDVREKRLYVRAKNKPVKIKIIPDIMLRSIPDLSGMDPEHILFTPDGIGGEWDATPVNRRDHFTKRFNTVVKKHFGLGRDYGLYSFRHTFITRLYREMIKGATPFEVKSRMMLITGHSSMQALEKYLRDIDAALPEDYSDYLKQ